MKKSLSFILSLVMLASFCCATAFSAETELAKTGFDLTELYDYTYKVQGIDEPLSFAEAQELSFKTSPEAVTLDEETSQKLLDDYNAYWGYEQDREMTFICYGTLSDGTMLVVPNEIYPSAINYLVIGKYLYITPSLGDDAQLYKDGKFRRIPQSYYNGTLSEELLAECAEKLFFLEFVNPDEVKIEPYMGNLGDVDGDGAPTVKDVTAIQKHLAQIELLGGYALVTADVNCDSSITVADATYIQKVLAGLLPYFAW